MKVKFKKLVDTAVTPGYAKPGDAGMDITAIAHKINTEHNFIEYHTGLSFEVPDGYVGLLFPRSSAGAIRFIVFPALALFFRFLMLSNLSPLGLL